MTVECESCKTRFHVADARIPEKGARVRCSRCHHRFHITPSYAPPKQSRPSAEGSAEEPVLGGDAAREQDQLDNPEFLFDKPEVPVARRHDLRREPAPEALPTPLAQPHLAEPPEPEAPPAPPEERVVASGGISAQELLDDGVPELPTGRFELSGSLDLTGNEIGEPEVTGVGPFLTADAERSAEAEEPAEPSDPLSLLVPQARPASVDLAAISAELGEDEDTSFADWDPLATPSAAPAPASSHTPARASKPSAAQPAAATPSETKRRRAQDSEAFDPEASGPAALVLRIAAVIVGLALVGAAGRLIWLQRAPVPTQPETVQAAGWIAADLETFLARDASGERVVIVRGNLFPEGSAPPPEVEVRLLGADGEPLGRAPRTWLERIDDAEVAPDRLGLRLANAGGEIGAIGQLVTGFTAVIPDPPANVRRVEVTLHTRQTSPDGTATAVAPEAPKQEPAGEPAIELAAPSPAESPSAPSSPIGDEVVPAAPEPE